MVSRCLNKYILFCRCFRKHALMASNTNFRSRLLIFCPCACSLCISSCWFAPPHLNSAGVTLTSWISAVTSLMLCGWAVLVLFWLKVGFCYQRFPCDDYCLLHVGGGAYIHADPCWFDWHCEDIQSHYCPLKPLTAKLTLNITLKLSYKNNLVTLPQTEALHWCPVCSTFTEMCVLSFKHL